MWACTPRFKYINSHVNNKLWVLFSQTVIYICVHIIILKKNKINKKVHQLKWHLLFLIFIFINLCWVFSSIFRVPFLQLLLQISPYSAIWFSLYISIGVQSSERYRYEQSSDTLRVRHWSHFHLSSRWRNSKMRTSLQNPISSFFTYSNQALLLCVHFLSFQNACSSK